MAVDSGGRDESCQGGLGIALPPLCWLWANLLPPRETTEGLFARLWPLSSLDSVSAYYHTSAVWAFVGISSP